MLFIPLNLILDKGQAFHVGYKNNHPLSHGPALVYMGQYVHYIFVRDLSLFDQPHLISQACCKDVFAQGSLPPLEYSILEGHALTVY